MPFLQIIKNKNIFDYFVGERERNSLFVIVIKIHIKYNDIILPSMIKFRHWMGILITNNNYLTLTSIEVQQLNCIKVGHSLVFRLC